MIARTACWLAAFSCLLPVISAVAVSEETLLEPGPENGGLRMRWTVTPAKATKADVFDVRVDLLNVSKKPITLRADWEQDDAGSIQDYLEGSIAIETRPASEPFRGATAATFESRSQPQPEITIVAGKSLTLKWRTPSRQLKAKTTDIFHAHNPYLRMSGLYAIHATIDVITPDGTVHLRSNEQLVSIGGSQATPRATYGHLINKNVEKRTGSINLGAHHGVKVGDRFDLTSKSYAARITITNVYRTYSEGKLESLQVNPGVDHIEGHAPASLVVDE